MRFVCKEMQLSSAFCTVPLEGEPWVGLDLLSHVTSLGAGAKV